MGISGFNASLLTLFIYPAVRLLSLPNENGFLGFFIFFLNCQFTNIWVLGHSSGYNKTRVTQEVDYAANNSLEKTVQQGQKEVMKSSVENRGRWKCIVYLEQNLQVEEKEPLYNKSQNNKRRG